MKLKYRLEKWEKALVFQVLEQDERFRAGRYILQYKSIITSSQPSLGCIEVFLRGKDRDYDDNVCRCIFESNETRDARFDEIQKQLKDWAANWPGWKKSTSEIPKEDGVYVL